MTLDIQFSAWAAITLCYFLFFSRRHSYTHNECILVGGFSWRLSGEEGIKVAGSGFQPQSEEAELGSSIRGPGGVREDCGLL